MTPQLSKGVLVLCVQVHRHGFWAIVNTPVFFVWQVKVTFTDSMSHKDYTGKRNAKWKRWLNKHEIIVSGHLTSSHHLCSSVYLSDFSFMLLFTEQGGMLLLWSISRASFHVVEKTQRFCSAAYSGKTLHAFTLPWREKLTLMQKVKSVGAP